MMHDSNLICFFTLTKVKPKIITEVLEQNTYTEEGESDNAIEVKNEKKKTPPKEGEMEEITGNGTSKCML